MLDTWSWILSNNPRVNYKNIEHPETSIQHFVPLLPVQVLTFKRTRGYRSGNWLTPRPPINSRYRSKGTTETDRSVKWTRSICPVEPYGFSMWFILSMPTPRLVYPPATPVHVMVIPRVSKKANNAQVGDRVSRAMAGRSHETSYSFNEIVKMLRIPFGLIF